MMQINIESHDIKPDCVTWQNKHWITWHQNILNHMTQENIESHDTKKYPLDIESHDTMNIESHDTMNIESHDTNKHWITWHQKKPLNHMTTINMVDC
jgi:hypothetical protein